MFALKTLQRQKTGVVIAAIQRQSRIITKSSAPSINHHQGGLLRCFTSAVSNNTVIGATPTTTLSLSSPSPLLRQQNYGVLSSSLLSAITITTTASLSNALLRTPASLFSELWDKGLYLISTLKRRKKAMNKHKLRKRRKKNRMKNKK
jgi:hypothetical protein